MKNLLLSILFLLVTGSMYSQSTVLFDEQFTDSATVVNTWKFVDQDGDSQTWYWDWYDGGPVMEQYMTSRSWDGSPLTPENWLISPAINLTSAAGAVNLHYVISGADDNYYEEHYKLLVSITNNEVGSFTDNVFEETLPSSAANGVWDPRNIDLTSYAGKTVYLAWVHYDCSDMYKLLLDSIQVTGQTGIGIQTPVSARVEIVPNPAVDDMYVKGDFHNANVGIYSLTGEKVLSFENASAPLQLNVSSLVSGLYMVKVTSGKQTIVKKVLIK